MAEEMIDIGIIGGTNILELSVEGDWKEMEINTPYGTAEVDTGDLGGARVGLIRRHGRRHNKPPHAINHPANMAALKQLGATKVLALSSVGCLREDVNLPALMVPDDYIDFAPPTIYNDQLVHVTPGFDPELRTLLLKSARAIIGGRGEDIRLVENGIYFQFRGPRLETRAEIALIKQWADCTGMTAASEATIAKEMGIRYAVLCTMDNYGHGIKGEGVDYRSIKEMARHTGGIALQIIARTVDEVMKGNEQHTD